MHTKDPNWGRYAHAYDLLMTVTPYRAMLEDVARALKPIGACHERILDAGCGTGNLIRELCNSGVPGRNITALDVTPYMLAHARGKHIRSGVTFLDADLNKPLTLGDESLDAIVSTNVLYALRSPTATLTEFARILKPGGRLIITTPKAEANIGLILKAHAQSTKPDEYWTRYNNDTTTARALLTEAFASSSVHAETLDIMFSTNRTIMESRAMFFYSQEGIAELLEATSFAVSSVTTTYADQSILAVAHRI